MSGPHHTIVTAAEARSHLDDLRFEKALAGQAGLLDDEHYRVDLEDDIAASERLYVGLAVTELATLRAELDGGMLRG